MAILTNDEACRRVAVNFKLAWMHDDIRDAAKVLSHESANIRYKLAALATELYLRDNS